MLVLKVFAGYATFESCVTIGCHGESLLMLSFFSHWKSKTRNAFWLDRLYCLNLSVNPKTIERSILNGTYTADRYLGCNHFLSQFLL